MKKLLNMLRRVSGKRFVPVLAIAAAAAVPAVIMAWGPSRPTFTINNPAPYVTFNSITDNPVQGDERNFMQVKPDTAGNSAYADSVNVQAGQTYDVFVYYHNNAASNLNASGKGIAHGAYVKVQLPAVIGTNTKSVGYVGATNANPTQVWDDVSFNSTSGSMTLSYLPGTAHIYNKGTTNGAKLADSIVTTGAPIGFNSLNGDLPGCNEFAGYVTFKVKINQPNFTTSKLVSKHGANQWVKNYTAKPGETVDYLINYKNTGSIQQDNVVVKDQLPAGMTYVAGSSVLGNALHPSGIKTNDGVTSSTGINVGSYGPGGNAWVIFSATVPANDKLPVCGNNTLTNSETVNTVNGSKGDTANVTVPKECQTNQPVFTCDNLQIIQNMGDNTYKFQATATAKNGATVKDYNFTFDNSNTPQVTTLNTVTHQFSGNGDHTASVSVDFKVGSSTKTVSSSACEVTIPGTPPTTPPSVPPTIPSTGPEGIVAGVAGTSGLGLGISSWINSRRALRAAALKR